MWERTQFVKTYFFHNKRQKDGFQMGAIPVEFDIFQQQKRQIEHEEKDKTKNLEFTSEIISEK